MILLQRIWLMVAENICNNKYADTLFVLQIIEEFRLFNTLPNASSQVSVNRLTYGMNEAIALDKMIHYWIHLLLYQK